MLLEVGESGMYAGLYQSERPNGVFEHLHRDVGM